ncbi:hypothetical protein X777_16718, partial [Ooceraea biroi]
MAIALRSCDIVCTMFIKPANNCRAEARTKGSLFCHNIEYYLKMRQTRIPTEIVEMLLISKAQRRDDKLNKLNPNSSLDFPSIAEHVDADVVICGAHLFPLQQARTSDVMLFPGSHY